MKEKMNENGMRTIAFAYRDMSLQEFDQMMRRMSGDIDSENEIRLMEQELTFLGLVALSDPIR